MTLVRRTFELAGYATTAIGVLFAIITLWKWVVAIMAWGHAGAHAEALAWTFLTAVVLAVTYGLNRLEARGD